MKGYRPTGASAPTPNYRPQPQQIDPEREDDPSRDVAQAVKEKIGDGKVDPYDAEIRSWADLYRDDSSTEEIIQQKKWTASDLQGNIFNLLYLGGREVDGRKFDDADDMVAAMTKNPKDFEGFTASGKNRNTIQVDWEN